MLGCGAENPVCRLLYTPFDGLSTMGLAIPKSNVVEMGRKESRVSVFSIN